MSDALDRLAELVLKAETKAKSEKIEVEVETATKLLQEADQRNRFAQSRLQEARKRCTDQIRDAEVREKQLKELTKKSAEYKDFLEADSEVENLIINARAEIEKARQEAEEEMGAAMKEAEESIVQLSEAREKCDELRAEMERLHPALLDDFSDADRLLRETAVFFPSGELRALLKEVQDYGDHFGMLSQREQYAQMKIWIGRQRRLRDKELSEEEQREAHHLFTTLVGISKQYEPGYIEAFQKDFETDWDVFVAESEEELRQATEYVQRRKEEQQQQREQAARDEETRRKSREQALDAMRRLDNLVNSEGFPEDNGDEFRGVLEEVIAGYGASDEGVMDLVYEHRELITEGAGFRALRRNLDRMAELRNGTGDRLAEENADLIKRTRGQRVVLIGGSRREKARRQLEELFEFDKLEWEEYEGNRPAALRSLETRVRNRGMDLLLILKSFVSHHVTEKLRPLCQQQEVPCLMIDHGYGAAQVAQALRRGLLNDV